MGKAFEVIPLKLLPSWVMVALRLLLAMIALVRAHQISNAIIDLQVVQMQVAAPTRTKAFEGYLEVCS